MKKLMMLMALMVATLAVAKDKGAKKQKAANPSVNTVAILTFSEFNRGAAGLGDPLANILCAKMSASPKVRIVERTELKKLLKEKMSNLDGIVTSKQVAKICELSGATLLVTGYIVKEKDKTSLATTMFDAGGRKVNGVLVEGTNPLDTLAAKLSEQIMDAIAKKGENDSAEVKK